jgi:hypothetical protein
MLLFFLTSAAIFLLAADEPPRQAEVTNEIRSELSAAFTERISYSTSTDLLVYNLFTPEIDTAFTTLDGDIAVVWLALRDNHGKILATEPGLAFAKKIKGVWKIILPDDPDWNEVFSAVPQEMLPLEQQMPPDTYQLSDLSEMSTLTGYYLPYAAGTKQWLEGSISHFQSIPELGYPSCSEINGINPCRYAYDFTNVDHFPLLASKEATVFASRDSCYNEDSSCTNYIVLKDTSTPTYQIYIHLAHNTIPDKLTNGTFVKRGQYIGDTDDTGYSTSNHVHFMVVDSIWAASGYYWGFSTDIRFADVPINGGIPRTCYEVTNFPIYDGANECIGDKSDPSNPNNDWFVSGNIGAFPPTGTLTRPVAGAIVASGVSPMIDVAATASDDVRVTAVQMVVKLNGQWVEVGEKITNTVSPGTYDWDVNLCEAAPVNGPLEVALRVWDYESNVASAINSRTIQVDHACPPPSSQLNPAISYDSTATKLSWSATNAGAGLGTFELQWMTVPGTWDAANTIRMPGNLRSTWFAGQPGGNYVFRLRALDVNGQPESWPIDNAFETSVIFPFVCVPDPFEEDDNFNEVKSIIPGVAELRNLCAVGDPDWFDVQIAEAGDYMIQASSINGGAAVKIMLYGEDGVTLISNAEAPGIGQHASIILHIDNPGSYKIKIEPLVENLIGTDAVYQILVDDVTLTYLPLVER